MVGRHSVLGFLLTPRFPPSGHDSGGPGVPNKRQRVAAGAGDGGEGGGEGEGARLKLTGEERQAVYAFCKRELKELGSSSG